MLGFKLFYNWEAIKIVLMPTARSASGKDAKNHLAFLQKFLWIMSNIYLKVKIPLPI